LHKKYGLRLAETNLNYFGDFMNNIVLMAQVLTDAELRYTPNDQTPFAKMSVQFSALRQGEPDEYVNVVGWRELAEEMQTYKRGDQVVVEGRLAINKVSLAEGITESRVEITAIRVHRLAVPQTLAQPDVVAESQPKSGTSAKPKRGAGTKTKTQPTAQSDKQLVGAGVGATVVDDDIPF
jgi:single-strand DNA-binding protein